ncbi:protein-disulfide reductase DsbD domain-containing protein [Marinobacterium aestuariivivens]|uniref:Protein-disulfide reductase DsbD domain-containing protein n=1 Tax=Marinobacterium aestuariivivens TaxID=1698799 RepID=A0ABW2A3I7_9GAMM
MALGRYHRPLPTTLQYGADGRVRIEASHQHRGIVTVRLQITDGWHLYSHAPESADLYPTELLSRDPQRPLSQIEYPVPLKVEPGPGQAPLAQYRGEVQIRAQLPPGTEDALQLLELKFQACSDSACLAPETVMLLLPRRAPDGRR